MKPIFLNFIALLFLVACHQESPKTPLYQNQIGDTPFDKKIDDKQFKFCDSSNVLHKRTLISYEGGLKMMHQELSNSYEYKSNFKEFSGYFIIRFAVNCNNKAGRFRMQVLDTNFNLTDCPKALQSHIFSTVKNLKKWKHAVYNGKDYDGYTFITIKLINGNIENP